MPETCLLIGLAGGSAVECFIWVEVTLGDGFGTDSVIATLVAIDLP